MTRGTAFIIAFNAWFSGANFVFAHYAEYLWQVNASIAVMNLCAVALGLLVLE